MGDLWDPNCMLHPHNKNPNRFMPSPDPSILKDKWPRVATFIRKPLCKPQFCILLDTLLEGTFEDDFTFSLRRDMLVPLGVLEIH